MDRSNLRNLLVLAVVGLLLSGLGIGIGLSQAPTNAGGQLTAAAPEPTTPLPSTRSAEVPTGAIPVVPVPVPITLDGNGLGGAVFGQPSSLAISELAPLLGSPTRRFNMPGDCTVDSMVSWPTINIYFLQGRFVGYSTGSLLGSSPGANSVPANAMTLEGLRIGATLAQAEKMYNDAIRTSASQGGSWYVLTPTGKIAGLLTLVLTPQTQIADISAGSVGCPATSP